MRECRTSGSVRGALSNGRPYRDSKAHKLWWMFTGEFLRRCGGLHLLQRHAHPSEPCKTAWR
jgi:hypothetical protein